MASCVASENCRASEKGAESLRGGSSSLSLDVVSMWAFLRREIGREMKLVD